VQHSDGDFFLFWARNFEPFRLFTVGRESISVRAFPIYSFRIQHLPFLNWWAKVRQTLRMHFPFLPSAFSDVQKWLQHLEQTSLQSPRRR
jgi:hypothetical protein